MRKILITGGAGFIGSHLVRFFVNKYESYKIFNLDNLSYAGNLSNLHDVVDKKNYEFILGDITNIEFIKKLFKSHNFDSVIHLAAESHVDNSIKDPLKFATTNVMGTLNLLDVCMKHWDNDFKNKLFYHVSTDEVYGSLPDGPMLFKEDSPYDPHSPYSASKASSDHFVRAYGTTYGFPFVLSNCSNNYGPNQYPEKLIPLFIFNALNQKPLPVYGDGNYTRDWLYVGDHVNAIDLIFHKGKIGRTYNIGGFNEYKNIDLVKLLCKVIDVKLNKPIGFSNRLITYVDDRPGHDLRYAIDASRINQELGWEPSLCFEEGLEKTVDWYLNNLGWLKEIKK